MLLINGGDGVKQRLFVLLLLLKMITVRCGPRCVRAPHTASPLVRRYAPGTSLYKSHVSTILVQICHAECNISPVFTHYFVMSLARIRKTGIR